MAITNAQKILLYASALEYYRQKPDVFIEEVCEIKLNIYQKLLVRAFFKRSFMTWILSRGLGKTWLGVLCIVVYCILTPNTKAGIIAPSFRQAKNALEEKLLNEICGMSPFIDQEIEDKKCSIQRAFVKFYNGSWIEAYPLGSDGAKVRGARLHVVLIDEGAYVPKVIIDNVVTPMLIVKGQYEVGQVQSDSGGNKILITSSASYRSNHLYTTYVEWTKKMVEENSKYFTMTLPYHIGVKVGLFDEEIIKKAQLDMSEMDFAMEYLGRFPKLIDGSWIKYDDIMACKTLEHIEVKGNELFEYIMSLDVARISGNDNTICQVWKMIYKKDHLEMDLVYAISMNGLSFSVQNERVRDVLRQFPKTSHIFMDTNGLGIGLADEMAKPFFNAETETWEKPLIDMNDSDAMSQIANTGGIPLIYGIKANLTINHLMGHVVKKYTEEQWLHFYKENADEEIDIDYEKESLLEETKQTILEILNIVPKGTTNNLVQFRTKGKRKDRWSATNMAVYGGDMIFKERQKKTENDDYCIAVMRR